MKSAYKIFYYFTLVVAVLIALIAIYTDLGEAINRLSGHMTVMSQISWLSDDRAIIYCSISGIYYLVFVSILAKTFYSGKYKLAAIAAAIIFVSFIIQFILEGRYMYYPAI
jgi:hypothetical protein